MTTLTIKIPDKSRNKFSRLLKEIGGEVVPVRNKVKKEQQLLRQIEDGLKDVAAIHAGKIKRVSLAEGLRG